MLPRLQQLGPCQSTGRPDPVEAGDPQATAAGLNGAAPRPPPQPAPQSCKERNVTDKSNTCVCPPPPPRCHARCVGPRQPRGGVNPYETGVHRPPLLPCIPPKAGGITPTGRRERNLCTTRGGTRKGFTVWYPAGTPPAAPRQSRPCRPPACRHQRNRVQIPTWRLQMAPRQQGGRRGR